MPHVDRARPRPRASRGRAAPAATATGTDAGPGGGTDRGPRERNAELAPRRRHPRPRVAAGAAAAGRRHRRAGPAAASRTATIERGRAVDGRCGHGARLQRWPRCHQGSGPDCGRPWPDVDSAHRGDRRRTVLSSLRATTASSTTLPADNAAGDRVEPSSMTPEVDVVLTMPVVAAAALGALLLLVAASRSTRAFGTIAHESGHMVVGILTGHRIRYFEVTGGGAGATYRGNVALGPGPDPHGSRRLRHASAARPRRRGAPRRGQDPAAALDDRRPADSDPDQGRAGVDDVRGAAPRGRHRLRRAVRDAVAAGGLRRRPRVAAAVRRTGVGGRGRHAERAPIPTACSATR